MRIPLDLSLVHLACERWPLSQYWSLMNISPESFQKIIDGRAKPTCLRYNTEVLPKLSFEKAEILQPNRTFTLG